MSLCHDLPIPREAIDKLFAYLNSDKRPECDNTLAATKTFLKKHKLPVESTVEWLQLHGGYCDCEVLLNVWMDWDDESDE